MENLTLAEARLFVRSAIDELQLNESAMEGIPIDESDMDSIIDAKVEEAVEFVHRNAAPQSVADDALIMNADDITMNSNNGTVIIPSSDIMRLLSVKCSDSIVSATEWYNEDTPIAAMQSDPYAKGTSDNPVVIKRLSGSEDDAFVYYSYNKEDNSISCIVKYLPFPKVTNGAIQICRRVRLAVLNFLTGLVLMVYKDNHADSFFNQAKFYMQ